MAKTTYVTSIERFAKEEGEAIGEARGEAKGEAKGLHRAIELGLKLKFGKVGLDLMPQVRALSDVELLRTIADSVETATGVDEIQRAVAAGKGI